MRLWSKGAETHDWATTRIVLCLLALAGCDHTPEPPPEPECTLMGCGSTDGLLVQLFPHEGWPAGNYGFVIERDDESTVCRGRLPLPPCNQPDGVMCESDDVRLGTSGCALPRDKQAFVAVLFDSHPTVLDIDITRNGERLTHARYEVRYEESWPNGAECGLVCREQTAPIYLTLPKSALRSSRVRAP